MILIKGGTVIDGTGAPGEKKDVLIKDDRIVGLGNFSNQQAEIVIDGLGLTIAPGFIDINTDSDHYLSLFTDPAQQDFLLQGVTTIIGGHCGSSLAPLIKGSLESIRKWGDTNLVNVDWRTMGEFLKTLDRLPLGVNFGTLVGHATIRRGIIGEDLRDLTTSELAMMKYSIQQALDDGAFGVSTGLAYNHARNTPYAEILMIAGLAARAGGVYATHLRHEHEHLVQAVREAISTGTEAGVRMIISHFRPLRGFEEGFKESLRLIEQASPQIRFDAYPFDYSIVPIYTLLPQWAQQGSLENMQKMVLDEENLSELEKFFKGAVGEDVVIARAPGFDFLVGKTVAEYAKGQELSVTDGFLNLMRQTKLRAVVFKKNINFDETISALLSDRSFVASNSPSLLEGRNILENERAAKTFSKFLHLATERKKPLEWAINKMTMQPANELGLTNRGVIREGAAADLVVLRGTGAVHVLVGGKIAVKDGSLQGVYNGKVLRRS